MKPTLLLLTNLFLFFIAFSQSGTLDPTFGKNGIVRTDIGANKTYNVITRQTLIQSDGTILIILQSGNSTFIKKKFANGQNDSSYGTNGIAPSLPYTNARAILQSDGKLIVTGMEDVPEQILEGNYDFAIARLNPNGSLDLTFSEDGKTNTDFKTANNYDGINAVAIQNDGKIVVAGYSYSPYDGEDLLYIALARYNVDGSPDLGFNGIGRILTNVRATKESITIGLQPDGKIVTSATGLGDTTSIIRYNANGTRDNSFTSTKKILGSIDSTYTFNSLGVQADGKIVLGGVWKKNTGATDFALARFNSNGTIDNTFGKNGFQRTDFRGYADNINAIKIQPDGKTVAVGAASNGTSPAFAIARYKTNGTLDSTFDADGKKMTYVGSNNVYAVSVSIFNNKILSGGISQTSTSSTVALVAYNSDGSADKTLNGTGSLIDNFTLKSTVFTASKLQSDGKLVAGGYAWNGSNYDFAVVRYNQDGSMDKTFSGDGIQLTDFSASDDRISSLLIQPDGKIVAGGTSADNFALTRYNADGSLDNSFSGDGKVTTDFGGMESGNALALQNDGKILLAGGTGDDYNTYFAIARYTTNGTLDVSFSGDGKQTTTFTNYEGESRRSYAKKIEVLSTGKILVLGNIDGDIAIGRYNTDGTLDNTFSDDGKQTSNIIEVDNREDYDYGIGVAATSLLVQSDGKFIVAGYDLSDDRIRQNKRIFIVRYTADGLLDPTFTKNQAVFNANEATTYTMSFDANNKIILVANLFKDVEFGYKNNFEIPAGIGIARLLSDGHADGTFGTNGIVYVDPKQPNVAIRSIVISNSKLITTGYGSDLSEFGYNSRYFLIKDIAPVVTLTAPSNNAVYAAPAAVTLNATATDADGSITSVKFYNNGVLVKTDSSSPYSFALTNLAAGNYAFIAKATDNKGLSANSSSVAITVSAINKAPAISITSPATNAVYPAPATFTLNATATDADGSITKVQFYNGGTLLKTDSTSPYSYTLTNVATGKYLYSAKATDNKGLSTASATIGVTVGTSTNKFPVVSLSAPVNNAFYTAPANFTLNANASDADGSITKVQFYNNGVLLNTDSTSPYSYSLTNMAAGTYSIIAKATDNKGATSNSASTTVIISAAVNKAPVVTLKGPNNNELVSPATVTLQANATDVDGTISKVEFYDGGTLLATDITSPYSYTVNNVSAGNHLYVAKATDNKGLAGSSSSLAVTVFANKAPTISFDYPTNGDTYAAPAFITMHGFGYDSDGYIKEVKLYNGSALLATFNGAEFYYQFTNVPAGTYSFTAKATDNGGLVTTSSVVKVTVTQPALTSAVTRIPTLKTPVNAGLLLRLSPNPTGYILTIEIKDVVNKNEKTVKILSASGVLMKSSKFGNSNILRYDVSSFANGLYVVKVKSGNQTVTQNFIKQ